jgi:hypothetical protein
MTSVIPQGAAAIEISCPEFGTVTGRREVCALLLTPEIVAMMERQNLDPSDVNSMKWPIFGLSRHATCKLLMNRRSLIDLVARDPQVIAPVGGQNTLVEWNSEAAYRIWFICGSKAESGTTRFDRMRLAEIQPLVSVEMGDPVIGDALYIVTFKCDRWAWKGFRSTVAWRKTSSVINWPDTHPSVRSDFVYGTRAYQGFTSNSITPDLKCGQFDESDARLEYFLNSIAYEFEDNTIDNPDFSSAEFIQIQDVLFVDPAVDRKFFRYFNLLAESAPVFVEIDRVLGCIGAPVHYFPIEPTPQDPFGDRGVFEIGVQPRIGIVADDVGRIEDKYKTRLIAGTIGRMERSENDALNANETTAQDGSYPFYVDFSEIRYNESSYWDIVAMPVASSPDGYVGEIWRNYWRWDNLKNSTPVTQIPTQGSGTDLILKYAYFPHNPFSDQRFISFCLPSLNQSLTAPKDAPTFGPFANVYVAPDFATHVSSMDIQSQGSRLPVTSPISPDRSTVIAAKPIPSFAYGFDLPSYSQSSTGATNNGRLKIDSELWFSGWFLPDYGIMTSGTFAWVELRLQTDGKGFPHPVTKLWGKKLDPIMRPVPDDGQREITCSGLAKTWKTMDGKTRIHVEYPFGIPMLLKVIDSELIAPNQWKYTCEHALKSNISTQITGGQATFGINTFSPDIEDFSATWGAGNGYPPLEAQKYYAYNLAERGNGAGFAGPGYKLPLSQTGFNVLPIGKDRDGVQHEVYVQAMVYLAGAGRQATDREPQEEFASEAMAYFCMPNAIDGECDTPLVSESDYDGGTFGT